MSTRSIDCLPMAFRPCAKCTHLYMLCPISHAAQRCDIYLTCQSPSQPTLHIYSEHFGKCTSSTHKVAITQVIRKIGGLQPPGKHSHGGLIECPGVLSACLRCLCTDASQKGGERVDESFAYFVFCLEGCPCSMNMYIESTSQHFPKFSQFVAASVMYIPKRENMTTMMHVYIKVLATGNE